MHDSLYALLTGFRGAGGRECVWARESPAGAHPGPLSGVLGVPAGHYCVFRCSGRACCVVSSGGCPRLLCPVTVRAAGVVLVGWWALGLAVVVERRYHLLAAAVVAAWMLLLGLR